MKTILFLFSALFFAISILLLIFGFEDGNSEIQLVQFTIGTSTIIGGGILLLTACVGEKDRGLYSEMILCAKTVFISIVYCIICGIVSHTTIKPIFADLAAQSIALYSSITYTALVLIFYPFMKRTTYYHI